MDSFNNNCDFIKNVIQRLTACRASDIDRNRIDKIIFIPVYESQIFENETKRSKNY